MRTSFIAILALAALAAPSASVRAGPNGDAVMLRGYESGRADFMQMGSDLKVFVRILRGTSMAPQPVGIYPGSCARLMRLPQYRLDDVVGGLSTTVIRGIVVGQLDGRLSGPAPNARYAIAVQRSAVDPTVVACGDIRS